MFSVSVLFGRFEDCIFFLGPDVVMVTRRASDPFESLEMIDIESGFYGIFLVLDFNDCGFSNDYFGVPFR